MHKSERNCSVHIALYYPCMILWILGCCIEWRRKSGTNFASGLQTFVRLLNCVEESILSKVEVMIGENTFGGQRIASEVATDFCHVRITISRQ